MPHCLRDAAIAGACAGTPSRGVRPCQPGRRPLPSASTPRGRAHPPGAAAAQGALAAQPEALLVLHGHAGLRGQRRPGHAEYGACVSGRPGPGPTRPRPGADGGTRGAGAARRAAGGPPDRAGRTAAAPAAGAPGRQGRSGEGVLARGRRAGDPAGPRRPSRSAVGCATFCGPRRSRHGRPRRRIRELRAGSGAGCRPTRAAQKGAARGTALPSRAPVDTVAGLRRPAGTPSSTAPKSAAGV